MSDRKRLLAAVVVATFVPLGASAAVGAGLPRMTRASAAHYSRVALKRNFDGLFYAASFHSRCRVTGYAYGRCRVQWFDGDYFFSGRTHIWYSLRPNGAYWNYSYVITRLNEYCADVLHRTNCTRVYRVS